MKSNEMDKNKIFNSIKKGCNYLIKNTKKNGTKFIYLRDSDGKITKGKYNMLRHCGCLWALSKTYNTILYDKCNNKVITKLNNLFEYPKQNTILTEEVALIKDKEWCKLGGNALYALSINEYNKLVSKYNQNPKMQDEESGINTNININTINIENIHNGIKEYLNLKNNKKNSVIKYYKINANTNVPSDFESEYYPGEAVLSLCELKDYDPAFRIINELNTVRDVDVSEEDQVHDHWGLQGIELLYLHYHADKNYNKSEELIAYGNKIGRAIINNKFMYENRSCRIACRIEGLIPLYRITKNKEYLDVINALVLKLLKYQCKDANNKAYGAFIDEGKYQIDYTQHSISALSEFYKLKYANDMDSAK